MGGPELSQALVSVDKSFAQLERPDRLDRGTCCCAECASNTAYFERTDRMELEIARLGNEAADPVTVLNDEAFIYFLPGLLHVAAQHPAYVDQLVFHICIPDRVQRLKDSQAASVLQTLWAFAKRDPGLLEPPALYRFDSAVRLLEPLARG
jgi:hypothetical protein